MKDGYGWDHFLAWRSDFVYFLRQGCLEVQSLYEERGNTMCGLPTSPPTHTMVPHTNLRPTSMAKHTERRILAWLSLPHTGDGVDGHTITGNGPAMMIN
ncbi:hypothetical protein PoMZ_06059 [Pyricularia oryzae]|uniref:Uncharacterized protein n=1 Tax=Pyricularia oryzae TaxID=318829 RepID=A0A4P7NPP2_PYROR|nr:hypothetical protein PoMZ_06059 [Pyricularia oryzae]